MAPFTQKLAFSISANPGDTVLVEDGLYYEQINFLGKKPLMVASEYLTDDDEIHIANTIIDGTVGSRYLEMPGSLTTQLRVIPAHRTRLTLISLMVEGGLAARQSRLILQNNIFFKNEAS